MTQERQDALAAYILERAEKREERLSNDHPMLEQFWESYHYLNSQHDTKVDDFLNHSNEEEFIAINLHQHREMCLRHGQELPDMKALKKLLPFSKRHKLIDKSRVVNSPHMGKSIRCWIFKK
jgi:hypothetical protein